MTNGKWSNAELKERRLEVLRWWHEYKPLSMDQLATDVDEYAASEVDMVSILAMFRDVADDCGRRAIDIHTLGFFWRSFIDVECAWYKRQDLALRSTS